MKLNGEAINIADNLDDFDYKSLYPSITREFNIAPNTQIGKIEIDGAIHDKENLFKYDKYCRGGQFLQDYYSNNYIEFCERWFHLAGFSDMLDDMDELFSKKIPQGSRGLDEKKPFIVYHNEAIPQGNKFIEYLEYNGNNNNFINRYPEKRDNSDMIEYIRNNAQMDIDDIDKVMRRKQSEAEEDTELLKLFDLDDRQHREEEE